MKRALWAIVALLGVIACMVAVVRYATGDLLDGLMWTVVMGYEFYWAREMYADTR